VVNGLFAVGALAFGCLRDHVRRPAFVVSVALMGALLALLPRLGNPAAGVADNAALALELTLSSVTLLTVLWAGIQAVQAARGAMGESIAAELLVIPQGRWLAVVGPWAGTTAAALVLAVAAVAVGALGWIGAPSPPATLSAGGWLGLVAGGACNASVAAALGVLYSLWCPRDLAVVAFVAHVAGTRAAMSIRPSDAESLWTAFVPDPTRVEFAREAAFGTAVSGASVGLGLAASATQVAALLLLAAASLRRRVRLGAM
jgi:hypothetical protein